MPDPNELDIEGSPTIPWWLSHFRWPIFIALAGALFIGLGVLVFFWPKSEDKIEIINTDANSEVEKPPVNQIWADIGGAVKAPGVYQLPSGSRINDLLIAAGGISASANRTWIDQNLNRAKTLSDGIKIYIPFQNENSPPTAPSSSTQEVLSANTKINLNTATLSELDSLWGIGPVTADKIIAARPFSRPEDLLDKKIIKTNVYERIKDQITVSIP